MTSSQSTRNSASHTVVSLSFAAPSALADSESADYFTVIFAHISQQFAVLAEAAFGSTFVGAVDCNCFLGLSCCYGFGSFGVVIGAEALVISYPVGCEFSLLVALKVIFVEAIKVFFVE